MRHPTDESPPPANGHGPGGWSSPGAAGPHAGDEFADVRAVLATGPPRSRAEIVDLVCDDQVRRWRARLRIPAEAYIALLPELQDDGDAAFELVFGEFVLRESLGESPEPEEYYWRFPGFADRLTRQLDLHRALSSDEPDAALDAEGGSSSWGAAWSDDAGPPACGPRLPGYRIIAELGRGGMGVVYKARQLGLDRLVALKVIRTGAADDTEAAARFRAEAEAAARFQHPNIIPVYEVGEFEGLSYLALEYAAGGSLQARLAGTPEEPRGAALRIEPLARAIHYAHQRGIVHRDLKPANVVITEDGVAKVTDFGLAKLLERADDLTHSGSILGTPSYMAPEQTRGGARGATPAVDVYALGAILYESLTGRPPFKGATPLATLEQVTTQDPLPPGKLQRGTPRDLETVCLKCLEKDPGRRYATALDLADDLRRFLDGRPVAARRASAWEVAWKWARRRPSLAAALASLAAVLVVMVAGTVAFTGRLQTAVRRAQAARRAAVASARTVQEQRNLALKLLNRMIYEVQDKLGETPATRQLRRGLLDAAIHDLDEIARQAEATAPGLSRAVAHQKLGDIYRRIGRAEEARRQLEQARQLGEDLAAAEPDNVAVAECLGRAYLGLGELSISADQPVRAQVQCRRAVDLAARVYAAEPRRDGARRGLIDAYYQLGRSFGFAGDHAESAVWFQHTRDLAERWIAEEPDALEARNVLARSDRKLGDAAKLTNDLPSARWYYVEAIAIGRRLVKADPKSREFKLQLARALGDLGGVVQTLGAKDEARRHFEEVEGLAAELIDADAEDVDAQILLVNVQGDHGILEKDGRKFAAALGLFRAALDRLQGLDRDGRLEGWPSLKVQRVARLKHEIAVCEAAAAAAR